MGEIKVNVPVKRVTLSAKIIRADGSIEDQGVIAEYTQPNPLRRFLNRRSS